MIVILGIECLLIDSATLATEQTKTIEVPGGLFTPPKAIQVTSGKTIRPPEWIPWSLITSGAVVILYSLTLPQRGAAGGGGGG